MGAELVALALCVAGLAAASCFVRDDPLEGPGAPGGAAAPEKGAGF